MRRPFLIVSHGPKFIGYLLVWVLAFPTPVFSGKENSANNEYQLSKHSQNELANLSSDINMLQAKLARLSMQVEQLTRENNELRLILENKIDKTDTFVTQPDLSLALDDLKQELIEQDAQQKLAIISEVTRSMERLAAQTNSALKALAGVIESQPTIEPTIEFSNDYSREGVAYTVQSGDTLSDIARRHGSTVKDIQNANRIAKPEQLQVGHTLFIPKSGN